MTSTEISNAGYVKLALAVFGRVPMEWRVLSDDGRERMNEALAEANISNEAALRVQTGGNLRFKLLLAGALLPQHLSAEEVVEQLHGVVAPRDADAASWKRTLLEGLNPIDDAALRRVRSIIKGLAGGMTAAEIRRTHGVSDKVTHSIDTILGLSEARLERLTDSIIVLVEDGSFDAEEFRLKHRLYKTVVDRLERQARSIISELAA